MCVCVYVSHTTCVFICTDLHACGESIFLFVRARVRTRARPGDVWYVEIFLITAVTLKPLGTPEAITSCVLEYFLNCSEMFRASPNDFHNRAVTWPFTPCEKNSCAF